MSGAGNTLIGIIISLSTSAFDAIGLNLMRKDHVNNMKLPVDQRRPEFKRKIWVMGLVFYVGSQLFGSTGALYFLQPVVVAPLGAASLIFNFLSAYFLVGSRIKRQDIVGTMLIITGAVLVAVFGDAPKQEFTLAYLMELYNRAAFIIYFSILETIVIVIFLIAVYCRRVAERITVANVQTDNTSQQQTVIDSNNTQQQIVVDRNNNNTNDNNGNNTQQTVNDTQQTVNNTKQQTIIESTPPIKPRIFRNSTDRQIRKTTGLFYATAGGMIASQTLLLAESGVRLVGVSAAGNNQFTSFQPFLIIFILLVTAFAQVYCMNSALKFASAVTVVPVFFAYYSILGFFNSNIYFDHWSMYAALNYAMILSGIAVLVYGVYLVSASQAQQQQQATAGDTVVFITGNTNTAAASTRTGTTKVHPSVDHLSGDGDRKEISTAEIKVEDIEDGEKGELQQVVCVNSTAGGDIPLRELNN